MFNIIFVLVLSIGTINCIPKREARIMGGSDAQLGEFPYMADIRGVGTKQWCGASIISEHLVLTYAACVDLDRYKLDDIRVEYGVIDTNTGGQFNNEPKNIFVDKKRQLALLQMKTKIKFSAYVQPVKLPTPLEKIVPGIKANFSGFGHTNPNKLHQTKLKKAQLTVFSDAICKQIARSAEYICAGDNSDNISTCPGDHGSPLTVKGVQIGVLYQSFCGKWGGQFIKVSSHVDWINRYIKTTNSDILSPN